jgi:hypothetical protein
LTAVVATRFRGPDPAVDTDDGTVDIVVVAVPDGPVVLAAGRVVTGELEPA